MPQSSAMADEIVDCRQAYKNFKSMARQLKVEGGGQTLLRDLALIDQSRAQLEKSCKRICAAYDAPICKKNEHVVLGGVDGNGCQKAPRCEIRPECEVAYPAVMPNCKPGEKIEYKEDNCGAKRPICVAGKECPLYPAVEPNCKRGEEVVRGGKDEYGCQLPPSCRKVYFSR